MKVSAKKKVGAKQMSQKQTNEGVIDFQHNYKATKNHCLPLEFSDFSYFVQLKYFLLILCGWT